jgi:hypothetical protein
MTAEQVEGRSSRISSVVALRVLLSKRGAMGTRKLNREGALEVPMHRLVKQSLRMHTSCLEGARCAS